MKKYVFIISTHATHLAQRAPETASTRVRHLLAASELHR